MTRGGRVSSRCAERHTRCCSPRPGGVDTMLRQGQGSDEAEWGSCSDLTVVLAEDGLLQIEENRDPFYLCPQTELTRSTNWSSSSVSVLLGLFSWILTQESQVRRQRKGHRDRNHNAPQLTIIVETSSVQPRRTLAHRRPRDSHAQSGFDFGRFRPHIPPPLHLGDEHGCGKPVIYGGIIS